MAQIPGYDGVCEYIKEAAYGTTPTSGTMQWMGHVTKVTTKSTIDTEEKYRLRPSAATDKRTAAQIQHKLEHHSVTIEYCPQLISSTIDWTDFAQLALGATNALVDALTSVTIYHAPKEAVVEFASIGCIASSFEMACSGPGEDIVGTMEFLAKDTEVTSDVAISFTAGDMVHATEISSDVLDFEDTEVTVAAATMSMCTGWSFKVDNKAEERYRLEASPELAAEIVVKPRSITGKVTFDFENTVEYDLLLARAGVTITIKIGAKTVTLTECSFQSIEVPSAPEDLIAVDMPFVATGLTIA